MKKIIIISAALLAALTASPAAAGGLAPENSCYTSETTHKDYHKAIEAAEKATGRQMEYIGKRTYFYQPYYIVKAIRKSKGLPNLYAVPAEGFKKVFAMEDIGKNTLTGTETYAFYETAPFQDTKKEVSEAVRKLWWSVSGFRKEDGIRNKSDLEKSYKETFTDEFSKELMETDAFEESGGMLHPKAGRGADITLGHVRIELSSETPEERIFKVKAQHIDTEAGKGVYLVEHERNYEYRQINENGKWRFQKIKLYF